MRAARHADVPTSLAFAVPMLNLLIAGLECAGWSLGEVARSPVLPLAHRATREAVAILERRLGAVAPAAARLLRPGWVRLGLFASPHFVPFDLENYLRIHFTKVGDQTRLLLRTWIEMGEGMPRQALESLERVTSSLTRS